MGMFDGLEDPLDEVSDALHDFGADDEADGLDDATKLIQSRIMQNGGVPGVRARFLIGAPQPGTVPVDAVDWSDAIVQAGGIGESLLQQAGQRAGYAELGAAALEQELDKRFGLEKAHEHPLHWVRGCEVEEGLSTVWRATITLAKPDAASLAAAQLGLGAPPLSLIDTITNAFDDDDGDGWWELADIMQLAGTAMAAALTPGALADQVWDTDNPDELDSRRLTMSHRQDPAPPYLGKTKAVDYLGAFARLSLARRFDDDQFTLNERWFSGYVSEFEDLGYDPVLRLRLTRVTVRPHLHRLSFRRRHRVFKGLNAVEIVLHILKEHGIYQQASTKDAVGTALRIASGGAELFGPLAVPDTLAAAAGKLSGLDPFGVTEGVAKDVENALMQPIWKWRPKRDYCVQYGETDLELVERLLAEEGLTFFFEHRERLETLVIAEDPRLAGHKVLTAGRIPVDASGSGNLSANEVAWDLTVSRVPVPSGVTLRDRAYDRPYDPTDLKAGESLDLLSPSNLSSLSTLGGLEQMANQALGLAGELAGAPGTEDYAGPEAQWFEWPGGLAYPPTTNADDPFGYDAFDGPPMAQLRLEGFRSRGAIARGRSECATFAPANHARLLYGGFDVLHKPVQKPQRFMITRVRHLARMTSAAIPRGLDDPQPATPPVNANPPANAPAPPPPNPNPRRYNLDYSNEFEAQNAQLPYRPPVVRSKPVIHGVQTAIVVDVGRGEDPTTSPAEVSVLVPQSAWRVRVRMPWQRDGETVMGTWAGDGSAAAAPPDECSHWIRFAQPYAGAGFGALLVPRVGMEVVIGYEEGDPDRPCVLGALYSNPYDRPLGARHDSSEKPADTASGRIDFPARMQDSGFTSRSWSQSERGESAVGNRVRFDDSAGDEALGHGRIEVYAQHDLAKEVGSRKVDADGGEDEVLGDHVTTVLHDQHNEVHADHIELVHGDQRLLARYASSGASDWAREVDITGRETIAIGGGPTKGEDEDPANDVMLDQVLKDDTLKVSGKRKLETGGDETIQIEGEGAGPDRPGRRLDVAKGSAKVEIDLFDQFKITGDRRVRAEQTHTVRAARLDIKTHAEAASGETGGLTLDDDGAKLTTEGAATIEASMFTASSTGDRVIVKAATRIELHDGTGAGNRITLDAESKTIVIRAASTTALKVGLDAAGLTLKQDAILLEGSGSTWTIDYQPIGVQSVMDGPDVTFAATDEIWLAAPSIYWGDE